MAFGIAYVAGVYEDEPEKGENGYIHRALAYLVPNGLSGILRRHTFV